MPDSAGQAVPTETAMWRLQRQPLLQAFAWRWAATAACLLAALQVEEADARATKRSVTDTSVMGYLTERTCWWNEICKEEFQTLFRCKCPVWSFCRSPGRYYNAFCTMTGTGYIWTQPEPSWGRRQGAPPGDFDAADGGEPQQRARPSKNKSGKGSRSSSRATQAAGSA